MFQLRWIPTTTAPQTQDVRTLRVALLRAYLEGRPLLIDLGPLTDAPATTTGLR